MKPGLKRGAGEATNRRLDMLENMLKEQQAKIYQLEQNQQITSQSFLAAASGVSAPTVATSVLSAGPSQGAPLSHVSTAFDLASFSQQPMPANPSPGVSQHSDQATSPHTTVRGEEAILDTLPTSLVHALIDLYQRHYASSLPLFPPNPNMQWPWTLPAYAMVAAALRLPQATPLMANAEPTRIAARKHVIATATELTTVETMQALTIVVHETIANGAEPSRS